MNGLNMNLGSVEPPAPDFTDRCNNQVQAIVRHSGRGTTFQLSDEVNDLFNQSMNNVIKGRDFDFSQWFTGRVDKHRREIDSNGGITNLINQLNDNAITDTKTINQLNLDISRLTHCRQVEGKSIVNQRRARRISSIEAQNQLSDLRQKIDRDNTFISQLLGHSGSRVSAYQDTLKKAGGPSATYTPGIRYVNYSTLNVRSRPSSSGAIVGKLRRGDSVDVGSSSGSWLSIQYQGQPAYIWAKSTTQYPVGSQASGATSEQKKAAQNVQNAQNAQQEGERKNEELAKLLEKLEEDQAMLEKTT